MKKKLLSLLLSLAMMPALLPVSAMAADLTDNQKAAMEEVLLAQECSKEEIAELLTPDKSLVIDEDTELDEDFDGLVIVLSGCTLTIKGVKIGVGVVILPAAEKDETEKAVAKETKVILSEKTEVTVSGSVETLTVEAPKAAVAVEAGAKVDAVVVGEKAEVGKIEDEGGNAAVTETPAEHKEDKKEPAKTPAEDEFVFDFIFVPDVFIDDGNGVNKGDGTCCNGNEATAVGADNSTLPQS